MKSMDKFAESINHSAGETVRKEVMEGNEKLRSSSSPSKKAEWIRGAMERLDALVDEKIRRSIMIDTCPHIYPKGRIRKLRSEHKRLCNIDELLEIMRNDRSWKGCSYYDHPVRQGNIIYVTKVPYYSQVHRNATTEHEKRLAYCHCPWVRSTIQAREEISPIFCYCAAAWDKQLWEVVLEKPVRVEVVKSLVQGDDHCTHAIHLPLDLAQDNR